MKVLFNQVLLEFKLFYRDPIPLFWTFLFPAVIMVLIGWFFAGGINKGILYLYDQGETIESKQLVQQFKHSARLDVREITLSEFQAKIKNNRGELIVKISKGFRFNQQNNLTLYYNLAYGTSSEVVISMFYQYLPSVTKNLTHFPQLFNIKKVNLGEKGKRLAYIDFLCPGVIAMSLMSTCFFGVGMVIASYREKGRLRRLALTPLSKSVFIMGQIIQRYFVVLVQGAILIGIASLIFGLHVYGDILSLIAVLTVGLMTFASIGFLMASRAKKAETSAAIANLFFFPLLLLGGVYFPLDYIPDLLRPVVYMNPLFHLTDALRQVINYGVPAYELGEQLLSLGGMLIVCFVISVKIFSWE